MNDEASRLLQEAANEIKQLRAQNKLMKVRLNMFDDMMLTLHAKLPSQGEAMSPDLVFAIEKFLAPQSPITNK